MAAPPIPRHYRDMEGLRWPLLATQTAPTDDTGDGPMAARSPPEGLSWAVTAGPLLTPFWPV